MKYKYKKTGNIYSYNGVCRYKDSNGQWIDGVMYERDRHIYVREITDFFEKFEKLEN